MITFENSNFICLYIFVYLLSMIFGHVTNFCLQMKCSIISILSIEGSMMPNQLNI